MSAQPAYRRGDRGPAVAEIRQKLGAVGLLDQASEQEALGDPEAAVFDEAADSAVRAFQQQRGLTVDGVVGMQTYRSLDEARWRLGDRILSYAVSHVMTGDDIAVLQRRLLEMGFLSGRIDGVFGSATAEALREFQRNVGVTADGTCGPSTLKALDRLARTVVGGRPHALREDEAIERLGPTLSGKVVVIDPGHGGSDRGVSGHGLDEASVVEDLAARIEGRLTATGVLAFLTRGSDMRLEETDRARFANAADADLCISLHCDGQEHASAQGVATYFYGNDRYGHSSTLGERFASLVQREIVSRTDLLDCRGHAKTWELLRMTKMPAVRLELGYLTNPGDAARLADPTFRDVVAEAVVAAVQRLYLPADQDAPTGTLRLPELQAC